MSTRSRIGRLSGDVVTSIYCHSDGYLEHVGALLHEYYSTEEAISGLLALGDISALGVDLESTRDYFSMRGEVSPAQEHALAAWPTTWADFLYVWEDGVWLYSNVHDDTGFRLLREPLEPGRCVCT
jgi:hypothetical protein